MAYTYKRAITDLLDYLNLEDDQITVIENTNRRGFICDLNDEKIVIFTYPISCKENNRQNFFDTRDSGANERKITWKYASDNKLKYFCLGINTEQDRYKNYILSLESDESSISKVSFRESDESVSATGTQINIPSDFIPSGAFERIQTPYGFYIAAIKKDIIMDYLRLFDNRPYLSNEKKDTEKDDNKKDNELGSNIILYGIPGCGKSDKIKKEYCKDENFMERTVFHPDYTYSDFVGQILPKIDKNEKVKYEFIAGPFTRILKKAIDDTKNHYYLVIEELNRGNAPAIFGDIFQLLDRNKNGESDYGINNESIAEYVYGKGEEKIKLPSNLSIIATMNTSDQNVFTLDTAFKRRWNMKHIENNIDECDFSDHEVCGTGVSWKTFVNTINNLIIENNSKSFGNEDNRIGAYFIKEYDLDDNTSFSEKVLLYLWNDAFRFDRDTVFKSEYRSLDELINGFKKNGIKVFNESVDFSVHTSNMTMNFEKISINNTSEDNPEM